MAEDKELSPKNKKKKRKKRKVILMIVVFILGILLIIAAVYIGRVLKLRSNALKITAGITADTFRQTETSVVYDINGDEITSFSGIKELYYLNSESIPDILKTIFVDTEDKDFYSHNGIDVSAILRATIANVTHNDIEQGASTITQQLAKNIFLTQDVNWNRKITEMFVAFELENKFSKEQILEFYINNIYFANGYYGVQAAAEGYFDKDVNELSLSQLAFIAGIPNNPSRYDPIAHPKAAMDRRDRILKQLYADGDISSLDYYKAVEEDIIINANDDSRYNYVETYVFYCATRALMEDNGFVFRYSFESDEDQQNYQDVYDTWYSEYQKSLFTGGYRIYTAIDMDKEALLQEAVDNNLTTFTDTNDEGIYKLQSAAVCIDNSTGYVTAIVGGRSQEYDGYTLNRAYQSYRQPGSSIKPVLVYAPYLMTGHTPDETIEDEFFDGGPQNNGNTYHGTITLTEALGYSSNVCAWKLMDEMTPSYAMSFLHSMNFDKIYMDDNNVAAGIGGFTYGVTPVELASAYAALENDGQYRIATCVDKITNSRGETLIDNSQTNAQVYTQDASRMVTGMLKWGVEQGILKQAQIDDAIIVAKSGTTNDNKDGWLAGYSRYYTTVVWVGCDTPATVEGLSGGSYPCSIWTQYMEAIHRGLELKDFPALEDGTEQETPEGYTWPDEETKPVEHPTMGGNSIDISDGDGNANVTGDGDKDVDVSGMGDKNAR